MTPWQAFGIARDIQTEGKDGRQLPFIPKLDLTKAAGYEDSESSQLYKVA